MSSTEQLTFAEWNIDKGGFANYNMTEQSPSNEGAIREVIGSLNVDALALVDVFRWRSHYGSEEAIADLVGMKRVYHTPLGDESMIKDSPEAAELGIVFATNKKVGYFNDIDLETRQASRVVLDVGKYGLQVATAYLHHEDEDKRIQQARALNAQLLDMPTVILGDLNTLRPLETARFSEKARSAVIRLATTMMPSGNIKSTLQALERREALSILLDAGFADGDPKQRPTALGKKRVFGVDYALSRGENTSISNVTTLPHRGASDHRILSGTVHFPGTE
jgi:hypothetical protein